MAETLNTYSEPAPDTSHEEAMLAKAEKLESAGTERPDWLPEKFKSVEDMAKAYSELEKKMSSKSEPEVTSEETKEEPAPTADATEVAKVLDNAGVNFDTLQSEYNENGGLTDESYKALEEKGFSRDLVDTWIAGQEAIANQTTNQIYQTVGGEAEYNSMTEWAANNLSSSEIEAFNRTVDSGDINMTNLAVQGLLSRYRSEVGSEPKLIQGEATSTTSGAFNSAAELTAAMRDPRYHVDPAYRRSVAEKLSRSNVF